MRTRHSQPDFQFARFTLSRHEFGIDVRSVREIIKPREIKKASGLPDFVEGFLRLRSIAVPVIDLRKRFSLDAVNNEHTRIIVCSIGARIAGLLVDNINDIGAGGKELAGERNLASGPWAGCVEATLDSGEGPVMIINLDMLLSESEMKFFETPIKATVDVT
ncbi:MAG: purine-binding chemotaxis protein CheW [Deltaproteobacteria bacterium]|nr:purine-binding chemotaxis protein CheW [Deltaproteobacteria bacterium]